MAQQLRQSFRTLAAFLNGIKAAGLTHCSKALTPSTFAEALRAAISCSISDSLKERMAVFQVPPPTAPTLQTTNSAMHTILLALVVLFQDILVPLELLAVAEKKRQQKCKEDAVKNTNTEPPKDIKPQAPLDLISLQELSSIHAASELFVWWGLGPRLPCGLRPELSTRMISKASLWSKSPVTLRFLICGTCYALGTDQPGRVNVLGSSDGGSEIVTGNTASIPRNTTNTTKASAATHTFPVDFTWCMLHTMSSLLSKPQLSSILLPGFLSDMLAIALTLSVNQEDAALKQRRQQHHKEQGQVQGQGQKLTTTPSSSSTTATAAATTTTTTTTTATAMATTATKAKHFLKWVTREKKIQTELDREEFFNCAPTVVVVGGLLRLMQHIGTYAVSVGNIQTSGEQMDQNNKPRLSTVLKQIQKQVGSLLSSILQRQGGLELMAGELLGHLQSPQGGADPSQSEIRVMELAVTVPDNTTGEQHHQNMLHQSLIMASRALTQERVHHSLVRVAVMIIARISAMNPGLTTLVLQGLDGVRKTANTAHTAHTAANTVPYKLTSLQPLFNAGQTQQPWRGNASWSALEVQRSISLLNVFLLAVPAEAHFRQLLRRVVLAGLFRLYSKLKQSKNGNAVHYKEAILLVLDSNSSDSQEVGNDLFASIIQQIPLHHWRAQYTCTWEGVKGTDTLGGISLCLRDTNKKDATNIDPSRTNTINMKSTLESLEHSTMSAEFKSVAATMEWLQPLSTAVEDLLLDKRSGRFLLGQLLCCFVEYYANLCLPSQKNVQDHDIANNSYASNGKDGPTDEEEEEEKLSSMLMVAHMIPLIVETGSSGTIFQKRTEILQCMSNVLRRVSMAVSVVPSTVQDETGASRAEYRVRNMFREPSIGFSNAKNSSNHNNTEEKEENEECVEWEEIASLALRIALVLLQSPYLTEDQDQDQSEQESSALVETVLRTFLPSLEVLCAIQSVRSVVAQATTLRVLIVTQAWCNSSENKTTNAGNTDKDDKTTTPRLERSMLIAMENTKSDHPAMRALGAVQLKQILDNFTTNSFTSSTDQYMATTNTNTSNNDHDHDYTNMNKAQKTTVLTQIVSLLFELLTDSDSYVYLAAVNGLVSASDVELQTTLDILLNAFVDPKRSLSQRTKLGEAVALASQRCGEVLPHYAETLIESFLLCAATGSNYIPSTLQTEEELNSLTIQQYELAVEAFRASCLSNLADVCLTLRTNVKPFAHRICNVVTPILQMEFSSDNSSSSSSISGGEILPSKVLIEILDNENDKEEHRAMIHQKIGAGRSVRRSATFVLRAVIQAAGKEILSVLTSHLSPLTTLLKNLATDDTDNVTKYHAKEALSEFDVAVRSNIHNDSCRKDNGGKNVFHIRFR